ncbi:4Fe-4S dicluster domain-containing protein [Candidatus Solincola tengchongensis]|uniref:4Fe-4S binding protein n=1 Tax=Candidatus Solincola tengchongensis TaxID=2900693 RepID=UPI00258110BE|nr:4Fe-4S dicluster domain-containing protein [Candidatus Solincola tengchongensis]
MGRRKAKVAMGERKAEARLPGDYPRVSGPHMDLVRTYSSPALLGPRVCDELVALVEHMYTEEEAEVARHLRPWRPRTAAYLARASGKPLAEVRKILHRLAHEKYVLFSFGKGEKERFGLLPILPGTFEHVLVRKSPEEVTDWHRRFAELFEALFRTGFTTAYSRRPVHAVRYLPVQEAVEAVPMALPSDRLEVIMADYRDFAVGVCQCRLTKRTLGQDCGRPLETCMVMGDFAPVLVREGRMRRVDREEALAIKREAEKAGLVTWMMNDRSSKYFKCSCSCCGCCCDALRQISEFNAPGFIAPPHFLPHLDLALCDYCGKCAKVCTMGAMVVVREGEKKSHLHRKERCIGCGLCVVACPRGALSLREVPGYRPPPANFLAYVARYGGNYIINGLSEWVSRRR